VFPETTALRSGAYGTILLWWFCNTQGTPNRVGTCYARAESEG